MTQFFVEHKKSSMWKDGKRWRIFKTESAKNISARVTVYEQGGLPYFGGNMALAKFLWKHYADAFEAMEDNGKRQVLTIEGKIPSSVKHKIIGAIF